jgi:hypothetical protein
LHYQAASSLDSDRSVATDATNVKHVVASTGGMFSDLIRQTKLYELHSDALRTGLVDCTSTNPAHVESAPELTPVKLLASPNFHRAVRSVHKKVHELQHGKDPAEMGGVNIDGQPTPYLRHTTWEQLAHDIAEPGRPGFKRFLQYYMEELKDQIRGGSKK